MASIITKAHVLKAFEQILRDGLLQIRGATSLPFCHHEADHLHNIPALIVNPLQGLIKSYFAAERPAYLKRLSPEAKLSAEQHYGKQWQIIAEYLDQEANNLNS